MELFEIEAALKNANIENAKGEARMLREYFSGDALREAVARRCTHYPLQYLLGEWDFYRERYEVAPACLIPRSDTEILVDAAVKRLPQGAHFLDLCTGSGCVAISTLANRTDTTAVAVDLFEETLALAARNGVRNGVADRLTLRLADVLQAPAAGFISQNGCFDAILSNPPYIRDEVVPTLQTEVSYEPAAALCGGADGLDFYRAILQKWRVLLKPAGFIAFEIGFDQGNALCQLATEYGFSCTVLRDYGGCDRVALLTAS